MRLMRGCLDGGLTLRLGMEGAAELTVEVLAVGWVAVAVDWVVVHSEVVQVVGPGEQQMAAEQGGRAEG